MKRLFVAATVVVAILLAGAASVSAKQPADLHCPDGWIEKTEADNPEEGGLDFYIPEAGTELCVKAGTENSGIVVADGATPLIGFVTWTVGGDNGNTPNVSYFAVYSFPEDPGEEESPPPIVSPPPPEKPTTGGVVPTPPPTSTAPDEGRADNSIALLIAALAVGALSLFINPLVRKVEK